MPIPTPFSSLSYEAEVNAAVGLAVSGTVVSRWSRPLFQMMFESAIAAVSGCE